MNYTIDEVIDELKERSTKRLNIDLPNDALLDNYEKEIGMVFSMDYRKFLKNLSNIIYGILEPLVITKTKDDVRELKSFIQQGQEIGLPKDWLPICEDNSDYYCLTLDNKVRFWSHNGETDEEWSCLASWVMDVWIGGN